MFLPRLCRRHVYSLPILLIAIAALSSACMWGVVTDATTGAPISGAKVTVTDQRGQSVTAATDEQGIFSFSPTRLALLTEGRASIKAQSTMYGTVTHTSFLDNLSSSFWNPETFELLRGTLVYWHDKILHLSLLFPAGWTIVAPHNVPMGDASAPDDSHTFCVMMGWPMIGGSLETTMKGLLAVQGVFDTSMQSSGLVDTQVRGLPAVKTTVTYKTSSDSSGKAESGLPKTLIYMVGLNDTWAYSIACQSSAAKYRKWEPKFEAIVHSLATGK